MQSSTERTAWFRNSPLGIFIHWGVYSAIGRGEWILNQDRMSLTEYDSHIPEFTAENTDFDEWANLARNAGADYMVLTVKHHDGFCLFRTSTTHRNAAEQGPKRDIVAEYVSACRRAGLRAGIYFSLPDWSVPAFNNGPEADPEGWRKFIELQHEQVRELMTGYGKIDLLWYDRAGNLNDRQVLTAENQDRAGLNAMVRSLQPDILINDRSELPEDFYTAEQNLTPPKEPGRAWEGCLTMNRHWGKVPSDKCFKQPFEILMSMTAAAMNGGHILLNIGPDASGRVGTEEKKILAGIGQWLKVNRESVSGTERVPVSGGSYGCAAGKGKKYVYLYLHWPDRRGVVVIPRCTEIFTKAELLGSARKLTIERSRDRLVISGLPEFIAGELPVVRLERGESGL